MNKKKQERMCNTDCQTKDYMLQHEIFLDKEGESVTSTIKWVGDAHLGANCFFSSLWCGKYWEMFLVWSR